MVNKMCRILVVDDQKPNRDMLTNVLSSLWVDVVEASDWVEALKKATIERFDLIVMDIQMPFKDWLQATRELRSSWNESIIVWFSWNHHQNSEQDCISSWMNYFFRKPQWLKNLIELVWKQIK
ncbi:MAG: histidine kinase [uncultured bacterium (gcode 4)]|uniref:Histidine kinase n=1 Tax=uncultured bacterium (gcode 4) TaxID=1234023 RepID=K2G094_9BACT|nr:MAG: histidine kinase [uncultured bacterium (gcode 4)]